MKARKKGHSRRWGKHGVSEIIGNILILGITVTLFTSVLWFVVSMPPPRQEVYTDFSATTVIQPSGKCWINVTNQGGQTLDDFRVRIYVFVNDAPTGLNFSDSAIDIGPTWVTGETWVYDDLTGVTESTKLSISIIDYVANSMIWSSVLRGEEGAFPPIIGDRGTYGEPVLGSPSYSGDQIRFYATVMDPDGNLRAHSVYVDATSLVGISTEIQLRDSNSDGVFVSGLYAANIEWNNKTVIVNATDETDRESVARMTLNIQLKPGGGNPQYGPYYNYSAYFINGTYPPDATGGESGSEASGVGTTFYYIRRLADFTITRSFDPNEAVLVEIYSDTLANLALQNTFSLFHPITGEPIAPQSSTEAFGYGGIYGTFYRYVYNFTAPSTAYVYPLQMLLKDNRGTIVNIADTIQISSANYPIMRTYKLVDGALVETGDFEHTDTVYVRVITKDVDLYSTTVYVSDIEVSDYSGRYVIKKIPPSYTSPPTYSAPLSSLFKTSGTSPTPANEGVTTGTYTMYMVLQDAYQGWWLPKKNAYTMKILMLTDTGSGGTTGEVYYSLSHQINVTAPLSTMDILASVGSGSFTWSDSGAYWEDSKIAWYKGGEQWDETIIDDNPNRGPIGMALADITGDGRDDVVVGFQDPDYANIVWYENFGADGKSWSSARVITMPFDAMSGTQTSYSTDKGSVSEDCTVWATMRSPDRFENSYYCTNELTGALGVGDFDGDGDGDVVASFIHVIVYTSAAGSGDSDYTNTWGMYFNRGIYVFWNDGTWRKTVLYSTLDWVSGNSANKDSNPAAMDIATADFNRDGYDDIVAVYEAVPGTGVASGATKVWLSQWSRATGDVIAHEDQAFGVNSMRDLPTVAGTLPWSHIQYTAKVEAYDVNLDQYPDVIRSSTGDKSVSIFYTQSSTSEQVDRNPVKEYGLGSAGTATVTGSMANLVSSNSVYETLTEAYKTYPVVYGTPATQAGDDTTSEANTNDLVSDNGVYYDVGAGERMQIASFSVDAGYLDNLITGVVLRVQYSVDAGYVSTDRLQWSDGGATFHDTTIQPAAGETDVVGTFDLWAQGVSNWGKVTGLDIRFTNNDTDAKIVHFDYMWLEITFVETRWLGWQWEIQNENREFHNLTIEAYMGGPMSESIMLQYSPDNSTWFNLTQISSSSETNYTFALTYTPNAYYYIRVVDLDRTQTDNKNNSLYVDRLVIQHFAKSVFWDAGHTYKIPSTFTDYVTGIAVGDLGRQLADYEPDGWPDIAICTAKVGEGDDRNTLFVATQTAGGVFDVRPVYTTTLAIMCPDNGVYDAMDIELGDTDGDGDMDIVLVVGAAPGREPGTGPTLWHYENNQLFATGSGTWQYGESYLNVLSSKGESAINVETGNIDLTILLPLFGVLGIAVAETFVERVRKRRE